MSITIIQIFRISLMVSVVLEWCITIVFTLIA